MYESGSDIEIRKLCSVLSLVPGAFASSSGGGNPNPKPLDFGSISLYCVLLWPIKFVFGMLICYLRRIHYLRGLQPVAAYRWGYAETSYGVCKFEKKNSICLLAFISVLLDVSYRLRITWIMCQQLHGYKSWRGITSGGMRIETVEYQCPSLFTCRSSVLTALIYIA
jgi:hypothetical protein